jgi:hypothetical protein
MLNNEQAESRRSAIIEDILDRYEIGVAIAFALKDAFDAGRRAMWNDMVELGQSIEKVKAAGGPEAAMRKPEEDDVP